MAWPRRFRRHRWRSLGAVPTAGAFLRLLGEAAANVERAGELVYRLMTAWPDEPGLVRELERCEQEGDRITHDIIHLLNRTTAPPIDHGDILALVSAADDVVDYIEEAASFLELYRIEAVMEQAEELTGVLRDACRDVAAALGRLDDIRGLHPQLVEVKRLEKEGDRISRQALSSLFEGGIDPMVIIRWKDIFERLEQAIDSCEHVANTLESIVVKHG